MIEEDKENKKKEEKDRLKNNKRKKESNNGKKNKHRKKKKQKEKAKQAEKNLYSVIAEKDGEEVMDDESVVFTEPSSSHPSLKAHCHDYH